jgi:kumamolisin
MVNQQRASAGSAPVGFVNMTLYADPGAFHDITSGNNGSYKAAVGWDACTGLGSPNGTEIASALSTETVATGIGTGSGTGTGTGTGTTGSGTGTGTGTSGSGSGSGSGNGGGEPVHKKKHHPKHEVGQQI